MHIPNQTPNPQIKIIHLRPIQSITKLYILVNHKIYKKKRKNKLQSRRHYYRACRATARHVPVHPPRVRAARGLRLQGREEEGEGRGGGRGGLETEEEGGPPSPGEGGGRGGEGRGGGRPSPGERRRGGEGRI
uniref:Uncharacterized protein n=1 Tax=Oryza sativa subsp. japonica TaxID=39947 RepID=Q5Z5U5_ORYSJ|nr:hypothetical protein [Oryza sativa Japonica Group]